MVPKEDRKKVPWYPRRIRRRFHGIAGRQRQGTMATKEHRRTEDRGNITGIDTTSHTSNTAINSTDSAVANCFPDGGYPTLSCSVPDHSPFAIRYIQHFRAPFAFVLSLTAIVHANAALFTLGG